MAGFNVGGFIFGGSNVLRLPLKRLCLLTGGGYTNEKSKHKKLHDSENTENTKISKFRVSSTTQMIIRIRNSEKGGV